MRLVLNSESVVVERPRTDQLSLMDLLKARHVGWKVVTPMSGATCPSPCQVFLVRRSSPLTRQVELNVLIRSFVG